MPCRFEKPGGVRNAVEGRLFIASAAEEQKGSAKEFTDYPFRNKLAGNHYEIECKKRVERQSG
jgi:hypothetical protein